MDDKTDRMFFSLYMFTILKEELNIGRKDGMLLSIKYVYQTKDDSNTRNEFIYVHPIDRR